MHQVMLTLDDVTFKYYKRGAPALTDVTLQLGPGIHLLLGENGSGKTTMLHLLAGLLRTSEGIAAMDGVNLAQRVPEVMRRSFFLSDNPECPYGTINQMARHHAPFYPRFSRAMLDENLKCFGLEPDMKIKRMSLGTRHKAFIAYALSLQTEVLLLDEPANGLDIESKKMLRKMLSRCLPGDATVLVSTHSVHDLERLYDGVVILHKGHVQLATSTGRLEQTFAFVNNSGPVEGAIFQERDMGMYRAICPAQGRETAISFALLYTAMSTPAAEIIVNLLWKNRHEQQG